MPALGKHVGSLLFAVAVFASPGCSQAGREAAARKQTVKKTYFKSGRLESITPMQGDKIHGLCKAYYESGVLGWRASWRSGKQHGEAVSYYSDGAVESYVRYKEGKELADTRHGVFEGRVVGGAYTDSYYGRVPYKNGVRHGIEHRFFLGDRAKDRSKQRVAGIRPWVNGELHGTEETFAYDHNTPYFKMTSEYRNSLRHGKVRQYAKDDTLLFESSWVCGIKHGPERQYTKTGKLKKETNWKLGKKHGAEVTYDKTGKPTTTVRWNMGKEVKASRIDKTPDSARRPLGKEPSESTGKVLGKYWGHAGFRGVSWGFVL
jgi:antitoxin component YwqK of YwqJK toxin-antitoxin module